MSELERLRALQAAVEAWADSPHTPRWRADHELLRALASYHLSGRPPDARRARACGHLRG